MVAAVGAPEETGKEQGLEISNSSDKKSESASEEAENNGVDCGEVGKFSPSKKSSILRSMERLRTKILSILRIQVRAKRHKCHLEATARTMVVLAKNRVPRSLMEVIRSPRSLLLRKIRRMQ